MKNIKKVIFIVLSVAIVIPFYFYKGQAATIPSSYKLTDHISITPKDQGWFNSNYNTCWAFASLNALETHIKLKSNGTQNPYFSARHLDYLTTRYYNSSKGMTRSLCGTGGINESLKYFMNQDGPVSNNKSSLTQYPTWDNNGNLTGGTNYAGTTPNSSQLSELDGYTPEYYVHKVVSFPSISKTNGNAKYVTIDSSYAIIEEGDSLSQSEVTANRNKIKQHIMENGGVTCLMTPGNRVYANNIAYSYTASGGGGHMVTIVGWDDDLDISAKTNGQLNPVKPGSTEAAKGAYLILNSYGYHYGGLSANDGFEWVSYYDSTIELCNLGYLEVNQTAKNVSATFSNDTLYDKIKTKVYDEIKNSTVAQCAYKYVNSDFYPVSANNSNRKITMPDLTANTYSITAINLSEKGVTPNDITELIKIAPDINNIRLDSNNLSNISGLTNYPKLTKLKANNNKIEDISNISTVLNRCTEIELKNQAVSKTVNNTDKCTYPNLFAQAKNSSSKVYSSSGLEFVNCTEKSDGTGVRVTDLSRAATVTIKSGNAQGSTLTINVTGTVDRTGPQLLTLNVINPDSGSYRSGTEVKISATFDENIYSRNGDSYGNISSATAPKLTIKFGNGTSRQAEFIRVTGRVIVYTITIEDNDEGLLSVVGFSGTVYDANENSTTLSPKTLGGSTIRAIKNLKGDVDGNGTINLTDALKLRRYIANSTKWNLTNDEKNRADVEEDGTINLQDALKLRRYIAASSNENIRRKHQDWIW